MNKRQRHTDAEWQQLVEQQQHSGLSASAFCQQHGLSSKTFYKRRRAQREATTATDTRFVKIQPSSKYKKNKSPVIGIPNKNI